MKTQSWKLIAVLTALALAALACANPLGGGLSEVDQIATTVAETLTASGVEGAGDNFPDPPATPDFEQPDAVRVAYVNNGGLWIWAEGVGSHQVYTGDNVEDVLFSDDGSRVAFKTSSSEFPHTGVWAVNSDGSNLRRLVTRDEVNALSPLGDAVYAVPYHWQFVPGTHTLAFNTRLQFNGPGLAIQDDIRLLDVDSGELSTLFDVGQGGMFYYSPDGSQIAVVKPGEIDLVDADGGNRRENVLVHPIVSTQSEYDFYTSPRWWADGSRLSVVIPSQEPFGDDPSMSVWTIPTDGSGASLESSFSAGMAIFNSDMLLSPDFSKVAYIVPVGEPVDNTWGLHIANLDGSGDVNFHTGRLSFVNWNPDSTWFAFKVENEYFLGQVGATAIRPLADSPPVFAMDWIDSGRFLYFSGSYGSFDIRIGSIAAPSYSIESASSDYPVFDISN